MTAYIASVAGNWSNTVTWGGLGPPVDGDTVTLNVPVTVDVNSAFGTDGPAGTIDCIVDSTTVLCTGKLTINDGVTLTVKGTTQLKNSEFIIGTGSTGGAKLVYAGANAQDIRGGVGAGETNTKVVMRGISGNPATISRTGGGRWRIRQDADASGSFIGVDLEWFDLSGGVTGSAGFNSDLIRVNPSTGGATAQKFRLFRGVVQTGLGRISTYDIAAGCDMVVDYLRITAPNASTDTLRLKNAVATTGQRICRHVIIDGTGILAPETTMKGWTYDDNYALPQAVALTTATAATLLGNSLFYTRTLGLSNACIGATDTLLNCAVFVDAAYVSPASEPKGTGTPGGMALTFTWTADGWIFETTCATEDGDGQTLASPSSGNVTVKYVRCLTLPNSRGGMSFNLCAAHGNKFETGLFAESCTLMTADCLTPTTTGFMSFAIGVTAAAFPGQIDAFENNLIWAPAACVTYGMALYKYIGTDFTSGVVTGAGSTTVADGFTSLPTTVNQRLIDSQAYMIVLTSPGGGAAAAGEQKAVASNTATTCTASSAFTGTLVGCTVLIIVKDIISDITKVGHNAHWNAGSGTMYDANNANATVTKLYGGFRQTNYASIGAGDVNLGTGTSPTTQGPKFRVTPGVRCIPTFASGYVYPALGTAAPAAWADTTVYSVGTIVQATNSQFYAGQTIYYRCVTAHTAAAANATNGKPGNEGTVTGWRTNWELLTVYLIREAIWNDSLFTDATLGLTAASYIKTMVAWIKYGYAPTSSAVATASSTGSYIGAVAYAASDAPHGVVPIRVQPVLVAPLTVRPL